MNEYNIKVNFEKGQILTNLKKLVQNDYNSTKLNFTFDKEGRVLFKLLYPDGTQYVDEIQNNELVFGPGILNQDGDYEYEIVLYTDDGRLTDHATKSFEVRSELVNTDELVEPDDRVPVLAKLINEVNELKNDIENGDFNGEGTGTIKDVQVDGVSVVTDGVANINLSSLEKTLQDILTTIQGGELDELTISKIEELIVSYFENKTIEEVEK